MRESSVNQNFDQSKTGVPLLSLKKYRSLLAVTICSVFIFSLAYWATVEVKNSDYTHSLLVSQAILEHYTVQLDAYKDQIDLAHHFDYNYRIEQVNGHYYYFFPLAPSIFSVPAVKIAQLAGLDMAVHDQEYILLKLLAVITTTSVFIIVYTLGRCYLNPLASLVIALVSVLGSALISTLGVGLWNMNFTVILISLGLLLLARYDTGQAKTINPFWLGFLLFAAFWTRPTVAPFILMVLIYVFLRQRTIFLKLVLTTSTFFAVFVGWCWFTYDQWLPNYYLPSRLVGTPNFWEAFYGNAFSPARGFFVFSPFFVLIILGSFWLWRDVKKYDLFWLSWIWFGLFYLAVSRKNEDWWGGHQYGPRLLTDALPALILVTTLLWRELSRRNRIQQTIALSCYIILGALGIFINSYQGLYNPSTYRWNKSPNIDRYPEYLFDWNYPQFLASEESLRRRGLEHQQAKLSPYPLGDTLAFDTQAAVFVNWYEPETGWRWTQGPSSQLIFRLDDHIINPDQQYVLEILAASLQTQEVRVMINETELKHLKLESFTGVAPQPQILNFSGTLLIDGGLNRIHFDLPHNAEKVDAGARIAGMAFISLKLYPFLERAGGIYYFDSDTFETGFSHAEKDWRWTDDTEAVIFYPALEIEVKPEQTYALAITSGALEVQKITVLLNGVNIGDLTFEGFEPETHKLTFKGNLLKADDVEEVHLLIPNASIPPGDSRRLGLAFVSLQIYPVE